MDNETTDKDTNNEDNKEYNARVLAGGGLKGFGILGGIQYIIDSKKIDLKKIHYYAGTSLGAVICYFLAIGYNPIDIIIYCITNEVFDIQEIKSIESILSGQGMYDFSVFTDHFKKMTLAKLDHIPTLLQLYKQMNKTLFTCTYNITSKKKEYISYHNYPDMSCIDAITLSASLPFIFNDCIYNENYFILSNEI
jgi:predicted acylesterase/phospholipase RssA